MFGRKKDTVEGGQVLHDVDLGVTPIPPPGQQQMEDRQQATTPSYPYPTNEGDPELDELNGFWQRQSKRVARNPCLHLWFFLILGIGLSFVAMVVGEFSVSANTGGWQSRGTDIADRQTQLMMSVFHQEELFYGGSDAWENLINNVQPGWEDDDDDDDSDRRALSSVDVAGAAVADVASSSTAERMSDYLIPHSDRIQHVNDKKSHDRARELPFQLTTDLHRKLQVNLQDNGCDASTYLQSNFTHGYRLWPTWKTASASASILDPSILEDICEAEENTLAELVRHGLCFGCEVGCLPPYSIVLYARLMVEDGFDMTCSELASAWEPFQAETEMELTACVRDIKQSYDPTKDESLPSSCPLYFHPSLVTGSFDEDGKSRYSSSIFATYDDFDIVEEMYEIVDSFDRGSSSVLGAYDTQYEDFVGIFLDEKLTSDMTLAMGSAVVVAIALVIHTRSLFITLMGLLQIILSFPLGYFVYKMVLNLDFFPFLNFIGIFVVFALGAGDVFVAIDKWKNARLANPKASTEQVAALALPDAAFAMLLTTLTTAVAFFATGICPVAPIQMFAIFCGLLVTFDYVMNVLLVFPALCIYDRALHTKGPQGVSCCITLSCCGMCGDSEEFQAPKSERAIRRQDTSDSLLDENFKPSMIRCVLFGFYKILHYVRWPLFGLCTVGFGLSVYYASTLSLPTSSDVRLLSEDSHFEQNYLWRQQLLSETIDKASGSQAYVIWGVKPADTGVHNNPGSWSQLVLDDTFNPTSEDAQVFLRDFCVDLFEQDFASPIFTEYVCPIQQFEGWLQEQANSTTPDVEYALNCGGASGLPMASSDFSNCIISWSTLVDETSVLQWDLELKIMFFPFRSRVQFDDQYDILDKEWKLIEAWVQDRNKDAPVGVTNGYFSSDDFWWYDTNGQMLRTAFSAAGIALACAAAVILVSSRSFVLTVFCTLTIGYVLASVTAMLVGIGWTLGFLESICFAILIGVSVDFVIHLGHAYSSLPGDVDRGTRTKYALITMGPSILATALTTILSATVMLFTVITFFQKFAMILLFTVLQASIGSFVLLLVMADCFGPSNPTYMMDQLSGMFGRGSNATTNGGQDVSGKCDTSERTSIEEGQLRATAY